MTNPTTPFSWQMPTSSDLVTDLPADFETFGQAVATSMADLLGGTSGQILSKASNTDMDFTWITNDVGDITAVTAGTGISGGGTSGAVTITNSMATEIAAKGDLIVGTGAATFDNLTAGANGRALIADSTAATGLAYSSFAPLGGLSSLGQASLSGASTVTISGISGKSRLWIGATGVSTVNTGVYVGIRFNGDSSNNYGYSGISITGTSIIPEFNQAANQMYLFQTSTSAADTADGMINLSGAFAGGLQQMSSNGKANGTGSANYSCTTAYYAGSAAITSVSVVSSSGNFDAGNLFVWGA